MSLFFVSVANSGIFYEYGAYFATAGSKKYMQNNTLFVGCIDFFSTFAPVPNTSRHCNRWILHIRNRLISGRARRQEIKANVGYYIGNKPSPEIFYILTYTMFPSSTYKPSVIEASKKSLDGLMELHQEMVEALATLQLIIDGQDTPLDPQTLAELKSLYSAGHLMLTKEAAMVCHIEAMQQMQENAETVFGEMKAGKKSNQDTPSVS